MVDAARRREDEEGAPLLPRHAAPARRSSPTRSGRARKPPHKPLALEPLTEWLAKRVGMEYLHIDPLKIDFSAVTEVMSIAYATRFHILPVGVTSKEVVIAICEPYVREWEKELQRITKLEIRRVIANPQDIERYQVEFYNLAKSMKGAAKGVARPSRACRISSSWSSWARTRRSTPTTRTSSRWWTGCGATPSSSARATSTSSRGASSASCASASTACCTRSTRSRPRCWRR